MSKNPPASSLPPRSSTRRSSLLEVLYNNGLLANPWAGHCRYQPFITRQLEPKKKKKVFRPIRIAGTGSILVVLIGVLCVFLFLRSICNMQCLCIKLNSAAVNDISGQRSGSMRTPYNSIIRIAGVCGRQDNSLSLCPFLSPWNQTFPVPKKFLLVGLC